MVQSTLYNVLEEVASYLLLFFLIFGMAATVKSSQLAAQFRNRKALCLGLSMQFLIMPSLGYLVLKTIRFDDSMGLVLIIVVSSPGGSFSNWWCSIFNADLALSVAMTSLSSALAIIFLPMNLILYSYLVYGKEGEESILHEIRWSSLFTSLVVVTGGIILGFIAGYKYDNKTFRLWANNIGSTSGLCLITLSILMSCLAGDDGSGEGGEASRPWEQNWEFYVGVAFPCICGLLITNATAIILGVKKTETVTLAIESSYQNVGIATSMSISMFSGQEKAMALCVPLYYGIVEAVILTLYCLIAWKAGWTRAPRDHGVCKVITTSYEIEINGSNGKDDALEAIEFINSDNQKIWISKV